MATKVSTIEEMISLVIQNPSLAKRFKKDPVEVAEIFGIKVSEKEAVAISQKLNLASLVKKAKEIDSFAQKVINGVGLKRKGVQ